MAIPLSRRWFLRQSVCAAVGTTAIANTLFDLRRIAAAATLPRSVGLLSGDYKALVCVFLYGGNDANNTIVPRTGSDYTAYSADRGVLALPQASLLPILPLAGGDGRDWGLHPSLTGMDDLFATRKLAIVGNVGPLLAPMTRNDYLNNTVASPPNLFSHSDQQVHWQTSIPDQPPHSGWGGRTSDLLHALNDSQDVSMAISLAGTNTFEVGNLVTQFQLSPSGTVGLTNYVEGPGADPVSVGIHDILGLSYGNLFEGAFRDVTKRAIDVNALLGAALASSPPPTNAYPASDLADQLKMVARLIGARETLGQRRQVFFCSVGGFDTHAGQVAAQGSLLTDLAGGLQAFQATLAAMAIEPSVTTFTASDFSRTWHDNGSGSDHAWGGHHFVLGGAVQGARLYGTMPDLVANGPDDAGSQGRWIPTTSVDEYAATLARWFGVSDADLDTVFPNLHRFQSRDLGFMGSIG
ncbi:MAG: DUF1501 domain-containing protein [Pseudolysinimonas sp.]